jgi:hypothetical protein
VESRPPGRIARQQQHVGFVRARVDRDARCHAQLLDQPAQGAPLGNVPAVVDRVVLRDDQIVEDACGCPFDHGPVDRMVARPALAIVGDKLSRNCVAQRRQFRAFCGCRHRHRHPILDHRHAKDARAVDAPVGFFLFGVVAPGDAHQHRVGQDCQVRLRVFQFPQQVEAGKHRFQAGGRASRVDQAAVAQRIQRDDQRVGAGRNLTQPRPVALHLPGAPGRPQPRLGRHDHARACSLAEQGQAFVIDGAVVQRNDRNGWLRHGFTPSHQSHAKTQRRQV